MSAFVYIPILVSADASGYVADRTAEDFLLVHNNAARDLVYEAQYGDALVLLEEIAGTYVPGAGGPVVTTTTKEDMLVVADSALRFFVRGSTVVELLTMADAALASRLRNVVTTDNSTLLDELARFALRTLLATESLEVVDDFVKTVVGLGIYTRTKDDTIELDDTRRQFYWDVVADSALFVSENTIAFGQPRKLTKVKQEDIDVSDLGTPEKESLTSIDDTLALTDANRLMVYDVTADSLLTLLDFIYLGETPVVVTRTKEDTFLVYDEQFRSLMRGSTLLEVLIVADASLRSRYVNAQYSDVLTLADAIVRGAARGVTVSDTMTLNEALLVSRLRGKVMSETLTLAEALVLYRFRTVEVTETLILFEQILGGSTANQIKTLTEFLDLTDEVLLRALKTSVQGETIATDDTLVASSLRGRLTAESLVLAEELVSSRERTRDAADAVVLSEEQLRTLVRGAVTLDLVSTDDSFLRQLRKVLTATDLITLIDAFVSEATGVRVLTVTEEGLTLLDEIVAGAFRERSAQDVVAMSEAVLRGVYRNALRDEALTMEDFNDLVRRLRRDFSEFVALTDEAVLGYAFYVTHETRIRIGYHDPIVLGFSSDGMPLIGAAPDGIILGGYNPS